MSKAKEFNPAMYESHFEAVKGFISDGHIECYDFSVCTKQAFSNALAYLCMNNIDHSFHTVASHGLYLVTLSWNNKGVNGCYSFWCEGEL